MASLVMFFVGITPEIAFTSLSAALISASAGVMVGIVRYLCLKNTVSQTLVCLELEMYIW